MLYEIASFLNRKLPESVYRNPVIYAKELHREMVQDGLSRRQLAERHGVFSDRITQWLCLLKLPEEKLLEIEALGDNWDRQVVTERQLRAQMRKG
jgi:transcriptional regulator with XRE-family HTH domain